MQIQWNFYVILMLPGLARSILRGEGSRGQRGTAAERMAPNSRLAPGEVRCVYDDRLWWEFYYSGVAFGAGWASMACC
jgi:hypothetical protein